jgi:hypothetical protein
MRSVKKDQVFFLCFQGCTLIHHEKYSRKFTLLDEHFMNKKILTHACFLLLTLLILIPCKGQTYALDWVSALDDPADSEDTFMAGAMDQHGNTWVCGFLRDSLDADPGPGVLWLASNGFLDFVVAKYAASGALIWAHNFGSAAHDMAYDLGVDLAGNVYVTGYFEGTVDFDPGAGTHYLSPSGRDIYVLSLDSTGVFRNVIQLNADFSDFATSIGVNHDGSFALTGGLTSALDFDPGSGITVVTSTYPGTDIFLAKYNPSFALEWVLDVEGDYVSQSGNSLCFDQSGNIYVSGIYTAGDFDPGPGVTSFPLPFGVSGSFLAKYSPTGNLVWASAHTGGLAPNHMSYSYNHQLAPDGAVVVGGSVYGQMDADPNPDSTRIISSSDVSNGNAFITCYNADGTVRFANSFGGILFDVVTDVGFRSDGSVLAAGVFQDLVDFDPGPATDIKLAVTLGDMYFSHFSPLGAYLGSVQISETGTADPNHIILTNDGGMVVCGGHATMCDFDPGAGSTLHDGGVSSDPFLAKYDLPPLAFESEQLPVQVQAYPNPVCDKLNIMGDGLGEELYLSLTDLSGHCVRAVTLPPSSVQATLDVHDLPSGAYLLLVKTSKGQEDTKKVMVLH